MRNFTRSTAGKTLLIILLILCISAAAAAAVGICLLLDNGIYRMTEKEVIEYVMPDSIHEIASAAGIASLEGEDVETPPDGIELQIADLSDNKPMFESAGFASADGRDDTLEYLLGILNENGGYVFFRNYRGTTENYRYVTVRARNDAIAFTDEETVAIKALHFLYTLRFAIYPIAAAAAVLSIIILIVLMCVSGRRPKTDGVFPGPMHAIPFDVMLACAVLSVPCAIGIIDSMRLEEYEQAVFCLLAVLYAVICVGFMMSAAARMKLHTLLRGTLIYRVGALLVRLVKWLFGALSVLPAVWRTALFIAAFTLTELILVGISANMGIALIFEIMLRAPVYAALLYTAFSMTRLKKGADRLADGDFDTKVSTVGMTRDLRSHAESLNRAADGMRLAVQKELKSERMKTALITNVSHDIKTPLTSVINYAGLIAAEKNADPKTAEYAEVLLRQSEKLKRLVTDLVDASRASSGDLDITLENCDARLFVSQADGEYRERMAAAGLTLLTDAPCGKVPIRADSRRMQRVFDNLMNNIVKYAQPGTRVYLTLEEMNGSAAITFRNTSREMLNIDPDELTERFVRGDNARNGEGSGLGLSIAKDLTALQGGKLTIGIDGDLFKVTLTFPICKNIA